MVTSPYDKPATQQVPSFWPSGLPFDSTITGKCSVYQETIQYDQEFLGAAAGSCYIVFILRPSYGSMLWKFYIYIILYIYIH